jgi:branched-chain amino acid transport system permease protein
MPEKTRTSPLRAPAFQAALIFAGAVALMSALRNPYYIGVLIFFGINLIITVGLSLLMGYAGQISLGQAGFFGLGAYTTGVLTVKAHLPLYLSFPAAVFLTAGVAAVVGIPTLRLKGHYLAMATLGLGEIVHIVFNEFLRLTGGPSGFGNIPLVRLFGMELDNDYKYFVFVWGVVAVIVFLSLNLVNSRIGRALKAIHKDETTAAALGIHTSRLKLLIFVLGAGYAAVAGFLYSHYVTYLSPGSFGLGFSVLLVTMVAIGGMENIWGAFIGTAVLSILPEYLRFFKDYDILIYGSILMAIMLLRPEGLYGIKIRARGR